MLLPLRKEELYDTIPGQANSNEDFLPGSLWADLSWFSYNEIKASHDEKDSLIGPGMWIRTRSIEGVI